ncbi:MAG: hypothetical protein WCO55_04180 [Candidatus Falkowbacteria bacterium]
MAKPAFTFIELMVTIGLVIMLLTLSGISYRIISTRSQLIMEANQIAVDIRQAQTYAASSKEFQNLPGRNVWGFYADQSNPGQYIIFNDSVRGNGYYDAGEEFRTVKLPGGITIQSMKYLDEDANGNWTETAANNPVVTFTPPDPKVTIKDGPAAVSHDRFYMVIQDRNNTTKQIEINFFGLIDVTH